MNKAKSILLAIPISFGIWFAAVISLKLLGAGKVAVYLSYFSVFGWFFFALVVFMTSFLFVRRLG